jgi:predicted DCC family thiol-disulfide oxidoreductase YuxK
MIKKLYQNFSRLYDKQIDAKGLALFRIAFALVLLAEVMQLYYFRHLIFDKTPYLVPGEIEMWPVLLFWMAALIFVILGLFTRIAAIINYILTVAVIGTISSFEYHMFYSYLIINFLFIFLPLSRTFSLDRLILKLKYSNTRFKYSPPQTVSVLAYYIPVLAGIGFVYFDSIFFKFTSHLWLNGLGMWLPASMPQSILLDISPLLNIKPLVIALGYITLVFEAIFLFTFWRKKWRVPMLIIGIGLHIGILICFPIPLFALGVIALYLLMIPVCFWDRTFNRNKGSKKKLQFYYDGECPLCNRTRIVINHFDSRNYIEFLTVQGNAEKQAALVNIPMDKLLDDIHSIDNKGKVYSGLDTYIQVFNAIWYLKPLSWIFRIPGIYHLGKRAYKYIATNRSTERCTEDNCGYILPQLPVDDSKFKILTNYNLRDLKIRVVFVGLLVLTLLQAIVSYNSTLTQQFKEKIGVSNTKVIKLTNYFAREISKKSKVFFGITHHAVFMDAHFSDYNHTVAVIYKAPDGSEIWLPIADPDGTPGDYLLGANWVKWTFRANSPLINQNVLSNSIRDFTAFWAYKRGVNLDNAEFIIKVKKNRDPVAWEYDFLHKQLANPWLDGGTVLWKNKEFSSNIKNIEEL